MAQDVPAAEIAADVLERETKGEEVRPVCVLDGYDWKIRFYRDRTGKSFQRQEPAKGFFVFKIPTGMILGSWPVYDQEWVPEGESISAHFKKLVERLPVEVATAMKLEQNLDFLAGYIVRDGDGP